MHFQRFLATAILSLASHLAIADQYNFYFPDGGADDSNGDGIPDVSAQVVKIINASTYTTIDGDLSGYYQLEYSDLKSAADATGSTYALSQDYFGSAKEVLDFIGSNLVIRENRLININDGTNDYYYDRVTKVNVETGEVVEQILVAENQGAFDIAEDAGYTVMLAESDISRSGANFQRLTTFSTNLTNDGTNDAANLQSDGGFISERIESADGTVLFRQEDDGTVHIGENSIVLADELVSNSGYDQIYSSSGVLELGNNSAHRTVITGTLEIQDPTLPNHAATKRYADGIGAMSLALSMMPKAAPGQSMMTAGMGTMGGQGALAVGLSAQNESSGMSYNFGTAYNDTVSEFAFGAGVGWQF